MLGADASDHEPTFAHQRWDKISHLPTIAVAYLLVTQMREVKVPVEEMPLLVAQIKGHHPMHDYTGLSNESVNTWIMDTRFAESMANHVLTVGPKPGRRGFFVRVEKASRQECLWLASVTYGGGLEVNGEAVSNYGTRIKDPVLACQDGKNTLAITSY